MLKGESIKKLSAISTPTMFARGQYICYEGEPGNEMYIILRGTVGIYVSNASEQLTEIARFGQGEIFGEMSVLDDLPRSASCIAIEDTVCIAVNKEGISDAVMTCPDIALMLLESMSRRLRKMNDELYKGTIAFRGDPEAFVLPKEYSRSHDVPEPPHDDSFVQLLEFSCPICGAPIAVTGLKKYIMTLLPPDNTYANKPHQSKSISYHQG